MNPGEIHGLRMSRPRHGARRAENRRGHLTPHVNGRKMNRHAGRESSETRQVSGNRIETTVSRESHQGGWFPSREMSRALSLMNRSRSVSRPRRHYDLMNHLRRIHLHGPAPEMSQGTRNLSRRKNHLSRCGKYPGDVQERTYRCVPKGYAWRD